MQILSGEFPLSIKSKGTHGAAQCSLSVFYEHMC